MVTLVGAEEVATEPAVLVGSDSSAALVAEAVPELVDGGAVARERQRLPDRPRPRLQLRWRPGWLLSDGALALAMGLLAVVPRVATAAASFIIADEPRWMYRSQAFSDALITGNPGDASASSLTNYQDRATMPGVVTMWIGSAARGLWGAGRWLGLVPDNEGSSSDFAHSAAGLKIAQVLVASVTAALVALVVLLVARWAGRTAAFVTGVVLATEPFLVAHSALLHTDAFYSLLGIGSLLAIALVVGVPRRTGWADRRHMAVLAGVLFGGSLLTKVSALMFVPSVLLLFGWAYAQARRSRSRGDDGSDVGAVSLRVTAAWWVASAAIVTLVAYPALWADPSSEITYLWRSVTLAADHHSNFFLGEATRTPGPHFYLVALPFRMTPWFFVALLGAGLVCACRPLARSYAAVGVVIASPAFVIVSVASKQFDRYGLPLLLVAAIVVGIAVQHLRPSRDASGDPGVHKRRTSGSPEALRAGSRPGFVVTAGVAALALGAYALVTSPWGLAYFNPLLGGETAAEETLLIGVGEGLDEAFKLVEEAAPNGCDDIKVRMQGWVLTPAFWACDNVTELGNDSDYVILYIAYNQRAEPGELTSLTEGRDLVGTVEIRGITYAEVFGPAPDSGD